MIQIVRHTSDCDVIPLKGEIASYERAVYVLSILIRDNPNIEFDLVDAETGRFLSWAIA